MLTKSLTQAPKDARRLFTREGEVQLHLQKLMLKGCKASREGCIHEGSATGSL